MEAITQNDFFARFHAIFVNPPIMLKIFAPRYFFCVLFGT